MVKTTTSRAVRGLPRRKTPDQLKSAVWPDEKSALADLKASKMAPIGDDYELGEYAPGSWQLIARDGPAEDKAPKPREAKLSYDQLMAKVGREQKVIDSLKRKPGAKRRDEPEVILHAKKPNTRAKPPGKAQETVTLFPDLSEEPEPETPPEPANPFAPLPVDGDYEIAICAADGSFPNNSVVAWAMGFSTRNKVRVHIRTSSGETLRSFNAAEIKAAQRGRGRPMKDGSARSTGKSDAAAALFMRPSGATFEEVVSKVTGWGITERFVHRLARARKCEVKKLGEKNFRLIKQA